MKHLAILAALAVSGCGVGSLAVNTATTVAGAAVDVTGAAVGAVTFQPLEDADTTPRPRR